MIIFRFNHVKQELHKCQFKIAQAEKWGNREMATRSRWLAAEAFLP